jgi:glycogen phosphorylase
MKIKASCSNGANWKQVDVKSRIPKELDKLEELARNMWWAWNHDARVLFRSLDEDLFDEVGQNPVLLLERLSYEKMEELSKDSSVVRKMNDVYAAFREYMDVEPDKTRPSVAYFCMEYPTMHLPLHATYDEPLGAYGQTELSTERNPFQNHSSGPHRPVCPIIPHTPGSSPRSQW